MKVFYDPDPAFEFSSLLPYLINNYDAEIPKISFGIKKADVHLNAGCKSYTFATFA